LVHADATSIAPGHDGRRPGRITGHRLSSRYVRNRKLAMDF
jgi:hypothetical protein